MFKVNREKCIACMQCIKDCPARVISLKDGKAEINNEGCIKCGHCVAICPVYAVSTDDYNMEEVKPYDKESFTVEAENLLNFIKFRSYKIMAATVDKGQGVLWSNKKLKEKLNVIDDIDVIDTVLMGGEKDQISDIIDEISGYGSNEVSLEETEKIIGGKEKWTMEQVFTCLTKEEVNAAMLRGERKGLRQGRQQGRKKGREKARTAESIQQSSNRDQTSTPLVNTAFKL